MARQQFVVTCESDSEHDSTNYFLSWIKDALVGKWGGHLVTKGFVVDIKTMEQEEIGPLPFNDILARLDTVKTQDDSNYVIPSRCYIIADDLVDDIIKALTK